eukprot:SAG22_NODE_1614_length_3993_cov_3.572419_4_plen_186_part_00
MNATQNTTYQPKSLNSKGVSIYDVNKDRMVYYKNPYGTKAKAAYKRYLAMGYEPWMILPPDLKHHPPSYTSSRHTFTKRKSKKPKAPTIEGRTSFKNFLASFTIHNHTNLKKLNGFKLLDQFIPTLQKYLQEHNGIKFYFNARYEGRATGVSVQDHRRPVVGRRVRSDHGRGSLHGPTGLGGGET